MIICVELFFILLCINKGLESFLFHSALAGQSLVKKRGSRGSAIRTLLNIGVITGGSYRCLSYTSIVVKLPIKSIFCLFVNRSILVVIALHFYFMYKFSGADILLFALG
jgi:hypothetical protein